MKKKIKLWVIVICPLKMEAFNILAHHLNEKHISLSKVGLVGIVSHLTGAGIEEIESELREKGIEFYRAVLTTDEKLETFYEIEKVGVK